jgi:hypothetical protein
MQIDPSISCLTDGFKNHIYIYIYIYILFFPKWVGGGLLLASRVYNWTVKPRTHYPHVTWARVVLRVQLGHLTLHSGSWQKCESAPEFNVRRDVRHVSKMCATTEIWEACWHMCRPELHVISRDVSRVDRSVSLRQNSMLNTPTALVTSHEFTWREESVSPALVATTHLKQAETKERNDRQRKVCAYKTFQESQLIWKVIIDVLRARRVYKPRYKFILSRKILWVAWLQAYAGK